MENDVQSEVDETPYSSIPLDVSEAVITPHALIGVTVKSDDTLTTDTDKGGNDTKQNSGETERSSSYVVQQSDKVNTHQTSNTTLFVESEQKINDDETLQKKDDPTIRPSPLERPLSAGRQRTPSNEDIATPLPSDVQQDLTSFRNIVTFDSDVKSAYPERTDSETNLIIQHLKQVTTDVNNDGDLQQKTDGDDGTFATSLSEEDLAEARRRQEMRRAEREAMIWKDDSSTKRLTMKEVIDQKVHQHYSRGVLQANEGQFESAVASLTKALNLQPSDLSCYVERGEAYLQMCDFRSAHLNYKKAHSLEPHNPHIFDKLAFISYLEGQCLFDQGLYSEALECFTRAAEMKPTAQGYHMRAITCLAALGRHQECLALVTRRLENETTGNPELYVLRARLHMQFGNVTLSYYDVRDALSLDAEQPQAVAIMKEIRKKASTARQAAVELTAQGRLNEALNKVRTAVETDPSVAEYHVFRGALHRRMQNFNDAIDDYLLAMDKSDHNETDSVYQAAQRQLLLTYNDFAVHCYHRGFYEEAVILLNKAIKGEKNEKGLYVNRGDCFFKLNDLGFALADYQQALEIDPTCWSTKCRVAVVHNEFGITAYQERCYDEAVHRFSLAIANNAKVGQFYLHRSRSQYMMQDVIESRKDILIALHLDPDNDEMVPLLSRLYPGRSVKEILRSKPAEHARNYIASTMGPHTKLPPMTSSTRKTSSRSTRSPCAPAPAGLTPDTPASNVFVEPWKEENHLSSAETATPGPRRMESDSEMIAKKQTISDDLQDLYRFSKSLKHTGPRINHSVKPKPPPIDHSEERAKRGYSWRKSGAGITST